MAPCQHCTAPADAVLCHPCTDALTELLAHVPGILEELDVALTRQAKLRPVRGLAIVDPVSMPYNVSAAEQARDVRSLLLPWVTRIREELGINVRPGHTGTAALARGLQNYTGFIRRMDGAAGFLWDLRAMVEDVRRVIDVRVEKVFVGTCRSVFNADGDRQPVCPEHLYAPSRNVEFTCGKCGTVHDVKSRQKQAIAASENRVLPPQMIARALTRNGEPLNVERLYNWSKRGLLKPAATDPTTGRKLYRVGDVLDVMVATDASPHNPRKALGELGAAA